MFRRDEMRAVSPFFYEGRNCIRIPGHARELKYVSGQLRRLYYITRRYAVARLEKKEEIKPPILLAYKLLHI